MFNFIMFFCGIQLVVGIFLLVGNQKVRMANELQRKEEKVTVECSNLEHRALFGTFLMLDSTVNIHLRLGWNWQSLSLSESSCCCLSGLVIAYIKPTSVFEKIRRECEAFKINKYMSNNFDLSDPLLGVTSDPDFHSF